MGTNLNHRPLFLLVLFAATAFFQSVASTTTAQTPPNVVLILSDDQAWNDYSFMGHETIKTPNLDALAKQSVLFRRGYVPTALCRPSLMTLVTGRYAHQHGVTGNDPSPKYASTSLTRFPRNWLSRATCAINRESGGKATSNAGALPTE